MEPEDFDPSDAYRVGGQVFTALLILGLVVLALIGAMVCIEWVAHVYATWAGA